MRLLDWNVFEALAWWLVGIGVVVLMVWGVVELWRIFVLHQG